MKRHCILVVGRWSLVVYAHANVEKCMSSFHDTRWPILTRYDQDHLARIALPLGGIGTGTVSLGGRGNLHDWEIVNRPAKGFTPDKSFFVLRTSLADGS